MHKHLKSINFLAFRTLLYEEVAGSAAMTSEMFLSQPQCTKSHQKSASNVM
jgi:hypothetical protein